MSRARRMLVGAALLTALSGSLTAVARADTNTAPYTDSSSLGPARLLDGKGQTVIGGPSNVPFGYLVNAVVATGSAPAGWRGDDPLATSTAAVAGIWTPISGAAPGTWSGNPLGASTLQPDPRVIPRGAVAPSTPTLEEVVLAGGGKSVGADAGYYEIRLVSVTDDAGSATDFYTVDLKVDVGTHHFTVVGPGPVPAGVQATTVPRPDTRKQQAPIPAQPVSAIARDASASPTSAVAAATSVGTSVGGGKPPASRVTSATVAATPTGAGGVAPVATESSPPARPDAAAGADPVDAQASATASGLPVWLLTGSVLAALIVVLGLTVWRRRRGSHA